MQGARITPRFRRRLLGSLAGGEDGAVAVILALMLAAIVGVMALAYDLGRAWNSSTELQTAVDAAALAGATQLEGTGGSRLRAVAAARSELARNSQIFANISGAGVVTYNGTIAPDADGYMRNENFRFLVSLSPKVEATSDADTRFIEVTVEKTVGFTFSGFVGAVTQASPVAVAVAGWETFLCGHMALMMCNPAEPEGNTDLKHPFNYENFVGAGVTLKDSGKGSQLFPGEFVWLAVVSCDTEDSDDDDEDSHDDDCETEKGADKLKDALGQVISPAACLGTEIQVQSGDIAGVQPYLNMRMDLYLKQGGYSSDPNFQPSPNFLTGLIPDPSVVVTDSEGNPISLSACNYNVASNADSSAMIKPTNEYLGGEKADGSLRHDYLNPGFNPPIDHMGYPRDNCAYVDEFGNPVLADFDGDGLDDGHCIFAPPASSSIVAGRPTGDGRWGIRTYMDFHHPDSTLLPADPFDCGTECDIMNTLTAATYNVDYDGDGSISRYNLYQWELNNAIWPDYGRPQCYAGDPYEPPFDPATMPDRRLLGVAVGNCNAITEAGGIGKDKHKDKHKNKPLPLASNTPAVNIFLTEAVGELDAKSFYGEIVGPVPGVGISAVVVYDRIVLSE